MCLKCPAGQKTLSVDLIDFILNIAAVLLWLAWRSQRLDPLRQAVPATLAGTLRRTASSRFGLWHYLAALTALLVIRAWFYWQIGPAVDWVPRVDLFHVVLPFRPHLFSHMFLFSCLTFLQSLLICYTWFLAIAILHHGRPDPDPVCRLILYQVGAVARWPRWILGFLPLLLGMILWLAINPLLHHLRLVTASDHLQTVFQGLLVGTAVYLTLKFVLIAILILHALESYVYLGASPLWEFIHSTAAPLLRPLNRFRLQTRRVDFRPLVAVVLIFLLLHTMPELVRNQLVRRNLPVWPG